MSAIPAILLVVVVSRYRARSPTTRYTCSQSQNLRELIAGKGTQSGAQISGDESSALQAGINAIIGSNVRGTGANGPFFILTDKTASYREGDLSAQMEVNWIGEYGC